MIEVEMRGVLNPEEYESLKAKLSREGKFVKSFNRLNLLYRKTRHLVDGDFSSKNGFDLKCRVTAKESELVVKLGDEASAAREEIEVSMPRDEFLHAVDFLRALGHDTCLATLRLTDRYMYEGVEFSLVKPGNLTGYSGKSNLGIYFEGEVPSEPDNVPEAKRRIVSAFKKLGLKVLKEHNDDLLASGGDASMQSGVSYYDLIKEINNTLDIFMDTKTEEGKKVLNKALAEL